MLSDKKIIVAGAAGLLGANLVAHLLACNASVIALDLSKAKILDALEQQSLDSATFDSDSVNSRIECIDFDIADESAVKTFFEGIDKVDGAVNCTYPRNASYGKHFFEVSLASFNENLALHLGSAFLFAQQCAAYFQRTHVQGTERVFSLVNMASIYGVSAPKFEIYENTTMTTPVEYAAIKSAIIHLNKYIASYINCSHFRVNSVSPGGILDGQPSEFIENYRQKTNGTGMLNVQDITGTINFLLSDQAAFVNGQNIIVDDGFCNH